MTSLAQNLRRLIVDHVQGASAADILAITSTLCGANEPIRYELGHATVRDLPRFEVQGDVVTDHRAGLMWMRDGLKGRHSWADAQKAAAAVTLGGHADWRLPTIQELLSLVDYARSEPAIDPAFACESNWYWTSTPYAPSPGDYAWCVNFSGGNSYWNGQSYEGFVRAVRAGQSVGSLD